MLENLEEMELEQAKMKKSRRKRKQLPEETSAEAVLNTDTLGTTMQMRARPKARKDVAGEDGADESAELIGD